MQQQPDSTKQMGLLQTQTEKPLHYTYLKEFRVEQCQQFLQHKCNQHRPYTCFYWHFNNQRRRRPIRRRDGTFNYSPEVYCTKYDESQGICPDGDECSYLHRVAGDVERRYHLRYFKTCMCVHDTDNRGLCVKNGAHCAFAHGQPDLRPPVFDIRELQAMEKGEYPENGLAGYCGPNSLDKERNMVNDDPKWQDAGYVLANYKTELCKKPPRLCRQGYACPQYHNNKDKRRSPRKFKYRSTPCPSVKGGDEWGDPTHCDNGDSCQYCHTRTEQQFHPEIYKSSRCHDMQANGLCPRGAFCAFAHLDQEISLARDLQAACESQTLLGDLLTSALSTTAKDAEGSVQQSNQSSGFGAGSGGGGMQRQSSETDGGGAKKSHPVEMNANAAPTNGYLSSSLPAREPMGMNGGASLFGAKAVGHQQQQPLPQQQHVPPPGLVLRSNSIGHRAVPSTTSSTGLKSGVGDSSPIISIPTNFSDTMVLQSMPLQKTPGDGNADGGGSSGHNGLSGSQLRGSADFLFQDLTAPLPSYSKAPGSEKEATRRRQLSAKEGSSYMGDGLGDMGLGGFGNLLSRGGGGGYVGVGSPFSHPSLPLAPGSLQSHQLPFPPSSSDGLSGPMDDLHIDDPFFGPTGHPLDFDDVPRQQQQSSLSSSIGGLSFSRGSAPVSIPTPGVAFGARWASESPTLSSAMAASIGSSGGGQQHAFGLAVGSPSVPPGFPGRQQQQLFQQQQQQHHNPLPIGAGSGRTRAESGAMHEQVTSPNPMKFGSLPASMSGPGVGGGMTPVGGGGGAGVLSPSSPEHELAKLREELVSNRSKMASWEEGIAQARKACEAWRREAETANARAQKEQQAKDEALVKLYLLQKEFEQQSQNFGSQNNNNNLLNLLSSVDQLPVQELRGVQAQLIRELEKITKLIQETEAKAKQ